ncbi:MAG TPA: Wzz/FepE/Etk N-terminal domain-containing protein, partial [Candidatus Baltobacteraceae bacterium]|nr:Wzz/FepE/Etk N-terminal domain-containing protein [Candidatus Baltobacteraceae bacterium]
MSNLAPYIGGATASYQEPPRGRSSDAADLLRIWSAVRKRWRLFCAIALGVVALVAAGTILAPKSYTTTVRMMAGRPSGDVSRAGPDTALPILNALVLENGEQSAETFAQLAQQRDLASKVITDLGLQTSPQALLGSVSVKPVVNTTLMNLTVTWKSPEKSAQIANAFAAAFVDQERDFVRSEAVAAIGFLSDELPQAEALMRSTASQLAKFQSTYGFIDAATHEQGVVTRMTTIDQRLDELNVDQSEATALLKSVNAQLASLSTTVESAREVGPNPVSADLNGKLAAVETQLAEAEATYTSAHPEVIALRRQRAELRAQIAALPSSVISQTTVSANPLYQALQQQASTYRSRIQGDQGQLRALRAERAAYGPSLRAMPAQAMQF